MKKFKNSLAALVGLTALAVAIPLLMPFVGLGSNTSGGSAPTNQTQNVLVVNTAQQPVPVTGSATVTGTVQAQQTGTWNVGINGTPTVSIDGTNNAVKIDGSSPVPIRDMDNPARNAFVFNGENGYGTTDPNVAFYIDVPANKRLVIEQLSVSAVLNPAADQKLVVTVSGQSGGIRTSFSIPGQDVGTAGLFEEYVASSQMRTYADAGDPVIIQVHRNDTGGIADYASAFLSGYLIDIP